MKTNIMKRFYLRFIDVGEKLRQAVAVLPWGHNLIMLNKELDDNQTIFYATEILNKGWNRDLLLNTIKMDMYGNLGFLGLTTPVLENELEQRQIGRFLPEYVGKMNMYLSLLNRLLPDSRPRFAQLFNIHFSIFNIH